MSPWPVRFFTILICVAFVTSGCGEIERRAHVKPSDLIIPVNITERLTHPEAEVFEYFQISREDFKTLGSYMLENERIFQTRPVILQKDVVDKIQDPAIQLFAERLFKEGLVKRVTSLNDNPNKQIDIVIDSDYGLYQQGITYVSLPEMLENDPSNFSYVKDYKDLGDGWYYYVYHYDNVKEEDQYRELAWGQLSEQSKGTLSTPKEKAIVTLQTNDNVGHWIDNRKPEVVVSVQFNTEMDGLLGRIIMFFDPVTKELVGYALRY